LIQKSSTKRDFHQRQTRKNSNDNKFSNDKNETNLGTYFGCGLPGHVVKDCHIIQKKAKKWKQKAKKEKQLKRAMTATWSDNDSSNSEVEEEQKENLCFMANEDQIQEEETDYESSDEIDHSKFFEY